MKQGWDIEQEPDRVATRRLLLLAGLSLVVALFGVLSAAYMLRRAHVPTSVQTPSPAPETRSTPLEQSAIEHTARGLELKSDQRKQLSQYRWLDRNAGTVKIPIERAMELKLEEPR